MKNIILWSVITLIIMIAFPMLTVAFAGTAGMAVCLLLFFVINPLFSAFGGIHAGKSIKKLWMLPTIIASAFLVGVWISFDMGEPDFLIYAGIYLIIGNLSMAITAFIKKRNSLFLTFASQEERRSFGGSEFIEIQFCRFPKESAIKEIVSVDSIKHWKNDSLYVNDENEFHKHYGSFLDCGIYNNLHSGKVDIYGINYYSPDVTDSLIKKIKSRKPKDYKVFIKWLNTSKSHNGFYVLGL